MRLRAQFVGVLLVVGFVGAYLWWILAALESESTPAICGPRAAPPRYDREQRTRSLATGRRIERVPGRTSQVRSSTPAFRTRRAERSR